MVYEAIRELVRYGLEKGLITEDDAIYARNQILEVLKMDEYEEPEKDGELTGAKHFGRNIRFRRRLPPITITT